MVTMEEIELSDKSVQARLVEAAEHIRDILEEQEWLDMRLLVEIHGVRIDVMHNSRMLGIDRIVSWTDIEHRRYSPLLDAIDETVSQLMAWRTS